MKFNDFKISPETKLQQWGPGEWVDEPDSFEFEHEGFSCLAYRVCVWEGLNDEHLALGHWCGYVMIPKDHPWYGIDFLKPNAPDILVHGGITFCEFNDKNEFWIGFDCAHSGDICPSMVEIKKKIKDDLIERCKGLKGFDAENSPIFMDSYKNLDFVIQEIKSLAEQARKDFNG